MSALDPAMIAAHDLLDAEAANAVRARCTQRVRKMLYEILNIDEQDPRRALGDEESFEAWNADSLDQLELTISIEDEFDIDILDAEAGSLDTVAKVVDHILKGPARPKAVTP